MKLNSEYKQIFTHQLKNYDDLKGKVVDKIAFTDRGHHDQNMFIILFTDKTYIAIGTHYKDIDAGDDEPQLEDFYVMDPGCVNGGNFDCHHWVDRTTNTVHFDPWITFLRDFGIWDLPEKEATDIINRDRQKEDEKEYQQYLRLKEKFENKQ